MKFITNLLGFNNGTFQDHTGQPSFTRKALAVLIIMLFVVMVAGFCVIAAIGMEKAKLISSYTLSLVTTVATLIGTAIAANQGAKGWAQSADAKAKASSTKELNKAPMRPSAPPANDDNSTDKSPDNT